MKTEILIEENLDSAIRKIRDKISDGNCTINEALYYIGNWQKEKDKAVNDSLLNALKFLVYQYEEMAKMSCADNHIEFRIKDYTSLSNGKEAIQKAEGK